MAKIRDPKIPNEFTPADQLLRPEGERITYLLKTPVGYDRVQLRRAIMAQGGKAVTEIDVLRALKADIETLSPSNGSSLAARVDLVVHVFAAAVAARVQAGFDVKPDFSEASPFGQAWRAYVKARVAIADIEHEARQFSGAYARALADQESFPLIQGIESARKFLVGWEGRKEVFERGVTGVPMALLDALGDAHLVAIGAEVQRLLMPTEDEEKNSGSPSLTPSSGTSSTTAQEKTEAAQPQTVH